MSGTRMLIVVLALTAMTVAGCGRRGRLDVPAPSTGADVTSSTPLVHPAAPTPPPESTGRFPLDFLI